MCVHLLCIVGEPHVSLNRSGPVQIQLFADIILYNKQQLQIATLNVSG